MQSSDGTFKNFKDLVYNRKLFGQEASKILSFRNSWKSDGV